MRSKDPLWQSFRGDDVIPARWTGSIVPHAGRGFPQRSRRQDDSHEPERNGMANPPGSMQSVGGCQAKVACHCKRLVVRSGYNGPEFGRWTVCGPIQEPDIQRFVAPTAVRPSRLFQAALPSLECRRALKCGCSCSEVCGTEDIGFGVWSAGRNRMNTNRTRFIGLAGQFTPAQSGGALPSGGPHQPSFPIGCQCRGSIFCAIARAPPTGSPSPAATR